MIALQFLALLALAGDGPAETVRFDCALALRAPNGQFTAPAPVEIRFDIEGSALRDIHVVDAGGILYPGGDMRLVKKADAVAMETIPFPAERPGTWLGVVEKKMYRLTLTSGALPKAIELGIARTADNKTGRFTVIWNASHQPEGLNESISGSGIGSCTIKAKDTQ